MTLAGGPAGDMVPVGDRGLAYGDGLFETIACDRGRALALDRHLDRLAAGCRRLRIPVPDRPRLAADIAAEAGALGRGVVRLIVTRGSGGRGYRPPENMLPTRLLGTHPWPEIPPTNAAEGVLLALCATRLGLNPALAGIKHLNRLEQVLASMELPAAAAEGLMLDAAGHVVEGTRSNVFLVLDDVLVTPLLSRCGVNGIMRGLVLDAAVAAGRRCAVRDVEPRELLRAQEIFVCNSLIGIWPVRALTWADATWPGVGPVASDLAARLAAAGVLAG